MFVALVKYSFCAYNIFQFYPLIDKAFFLLPKWGSALESKSVWRLYTWQWRDTGRRNHPILLKISTNVCALYKINCIVFSVNCANSALQIYNIVFSARKFLFWNKSGVDEINTFFIHTTNIYSRKQHYSSNCDNTCEFSLI